MSISSTLSVLESKLFSSKKRVVSTLFIGIMVLSLPMTLLLLSKQQDVRQRASETGVGCFQQGDKMDVNQDGVINNTDLDLVSAGFGKDATTPTLQQIDIVEDGKINILDLSKLSANLFQKTCAEQSPTRPAKDNHMVTICHATRSVSQPYITIVVDTNAIEDHFTANGTPLTGHEKDILLQGNQNCPTEKQTPTITPTTPRCPLKSQGDANCDGKINTPDFTIWRDEFLKNISTSTSDFNTDGKVDTDDFNIWRDGFLNVALPH